MTLCGILTFQTGTQFGHEINITAVTRAKPAFIIGSDRRSHLQINDAQVGASHAAITEFDGSYRIKPTLPPLRVFVNDRLVERTQPLYAGDVIRIGATELYFDVAERDLPELQVAVVPQVASAPRIQPITFSQPALAAGASVYHPATQTPTAAANPPVVMFAGVFAILSVIGALAYMMIVNPADLNRLITGREAIVYSADAVTLVMFDADW